MASLAVKYRPKTFEEVCGLVSIIKILRRQLETGQISNCFIFSGPSGCGKTTLGRIFAHEINKHETTSGEVISSEPIEIDGASNNGVDNVRSIISSANERALDGKYKIFIIDEAHMITTQAWNALLKCIEEPPQYTIFIFCTTDAQKIPATIINRCMKFNLSRIGSSQICERLQFICKSENFTNYEETCDYISRICHGQARDAISLLEKCAAYNTSLTIDNCIEALGNSSYNDMFTLLNHLIDCNEAETLKDINDIYNKGIDIKIFIDQFLSFVLDVTKYCLLKDIAVTQLPTNVTEALNNSINFDNASSYYGYLTNKILDIKNSIKVDVDPLSTTSVKLLSICRCQ